VTVKSDECTSVEIILYKRELNTVLLLKNVILLTDYINYFYVRLQSQLYTTPLLYKLIFCHITNSIVVKY